MGYDREIDYDPDSDPRVPGPAEQLRDAVVALEGKLVETEWRLLQMTVRVETLSKVVLDLINEKLRDGSLPLKQRYLLTDIRKVLQKTRTTTEERIESGTD